MLTLPYPTSPKNGDPLDASIIQANITAITQAVQSFDATQIAAGTISKDASFATALSPITRLKETTANFVQSGCTWSSVSGLQGTMAGGVLYINGIRVSFAGVVGYTFAASQDTYVDVDVNGTVYYVAVANNATTGMTLTPNAVRVAKIVSSASVLTIVQDGADPLGNLVAPRTAGTFHTDSNGWIVYERGTFREATFIRSETGLATSITANGGNSYTPTQIPLPTGVAAINSLKNFTYGFSSNDRIFCCTMRNQGTDGTFVPNISSFYSSSVNLTYYRIDVSVRW